MLKLNYRYLHIGNTVYIDLLSFQYSLRVCGQFEYIRGELSYV